MSGRWKLGDVLVWFSTGEEQGGQTDADVCLGFSTEDGEPIGWLRAFERGDQRGFEEGDTNVGFIGNLNKQAWLKRLVDAGTRLDISIDGEGADDGWFLDRVSLDFRVGPVVDVSTVRTWHINEWIRPGEPASGYIAEGGVQTGAEMFDEIGFDKELEIESGEGRPG